MPRAGGRAEPRVLAVLRYENDVRDAPAGRRPCEPCEREHREIQSQMAQGFGRLYREEQETRGRLRKACSNLRHNIKQILNLCHICSTLMPSAPAPEVQHPVTFYPRAPAAQPTPDATEC